MPTVEGIRNVLHHVYCDPFSPKQAHQVLHAYLRTQPAQSRLDFMAEAPQALDCLCLWTTYSKEFLCPNFLIV